MKKTIEKIVKARPFLKWAGGKTRLLPELRKLVPISFDTYYEPFLGGGSLFFDLAPRKAVLSDINPELVTTYRTVRDHVGELIDLLEESAAEYAKSGTRHYAFVRALDPAELTNSERAARMIFLNKTCFNGLYRVNQKGQFNTPPGKFKSTPTICDEENLLLCSIALKNAKLDRCGFEQAIDRMRDGDFAYFDPPYVPLSDTANFTSYAKEGFGPAEQKKLAELVGSCKAIGVRVLVSNSGTKKVAELYKDFEVQAVTMRRNINCVGDGREPVKEYLIT